MSGEISTETGAEETGYYFVYNGLNSGDPNVARLPDGPLNDFVSILHSEKFGVTSQPTRNSSTALLPTDEWSGWLTDAISATSFDAKTDDTSSISGFALEINWPGGTADNQKTIKFDTDYIVPAFGITAAAAPPVGLLGDTNILCLGLDPTQGLLIRSNLTEAFEYAGLENLLSNPLIAALGTELGLTLTSQSTSSTGARNAVWFDPGKGYSTTVRLQWDIDDIDKVKRSIDFLEGAFSFGAINLVTRRRSTWVKTSTGVTVVTVGEVILAVELVIAGKTLQGALTFDADNMRATLTTTDNLFTEILDWLMDTTGDLPFVGWFIDVGADVLANVLLRRIAMTVAMVDGHRKMTAFSVAMEANMGLGASANNPARVLMTYAKVGTKSWGKLGGELWFTPASPVTPLLLPRWEKSQDLSPLSPGQSEFFDLAKLHPSHVSNIPQGIPHKITDAMLEIDAESVSFFGSIVCDAPPAGAVPTITLDLVSLSAKYTFGSGSRSKGKIDLELGINVEIKAPADNKFQTPTTIVGSLSYDDGAWKLYGKMTPIYASTLYQFFDPDAQGGVLTCLEALEIRELELEYNYHNGVANDFQFSGILVVGQLELNLKYAYDTGGWSFEADLGATTAESTLGSIVESIMNEKNLLPGFVADIPVVAAGDGGAVSLRCNKKPKEKMEGDTSPMKPGDYIIFFSVSVQIHPLKATFVQYRDVEWLPPVGPKRIIKVSVVGLPPVEVPLVGNLTQPFDEMYFMWVQDKALQASTGKLPGLSEKEVQYINKGLEVKEGGYIDQLLFKETRKEKKDTDVVIIAGPHFVIVLKDKGASIVIIDYTFTEKQPSSAAKGMLTEEGGRSGEAEEAPVPEAPATGSPATGAPATGSPATGAPATGSPATGTPATEAPATGTPATGIPATEAPAIGSPATEAPATGSAATGAPATGSPATGSPAAGAPATNSGGKGDSSMAAFKKNVGPITISNIGFKYKGETLSILLDAAFLLGPIGFTLIGFSINLNLKGTTLQNFPIPTFSLSGLAISFNQPPVTIAGLYNHVSNDEIDYYAGGVIVAFAPYLFQAAGFYGETKQPPIFTSVFIFGKLEGPIVTLEFAEISSITGGFGYNSDIRFPAIEQVPEFPFVAETPVGGDILTTLTNLVTPSAGGWFSPRDGSFWVAAGLKVTAFETLSIDAVVCVQWNPYVKLGIFGVAVVDIPRGVDTKFAHVELGISAVVDFQAGVMRFEAQLSPNSFIFAPSCHLTGGFALYYWFKGADPQLEGDWVFTIGGFHRAFDRPAHYPNPPRLAITWSLDGAISITGEAYFAITPKCCMGGGSLHASIKLGPLEAWFDAYADFLINYKPFHFIADGGVSVGISCTIDLLITTIQIKVEIGAQLYLEGPPLCGRVHVDFWVLSFNIYFGPDPTPVKAVMLEEFYMLVLQSKEGEGMSSNALLTEAEEPTAMTKPKIFDHKAHVFGCQSGLMAGSGDQKTEENKPWEVRSGTFSFSISCRFAINKASLNPSDESPTDESAATKPVTWDEPIYGKPMQLTTGLSSEIDITIKRTEEASEASEEESQEPKWQVEPTIKAVPSALWGKYNSDEDPQQTGNNVSALLNGDGVAIRLMMGIVVNAPKPFLSPDNIPKFNAVDAMSLGVNTEGDEPEFPEYDGASDSWSPEDVKDLDKQWEAVASLWQTPEGGVESRKTTMSLWKTAMFWEKDVTADPPELLLKKFDTLYLAAPLISVA